MTLNADAYFASPWKEKNSDLLFLRRKKDLFTVQKSKSVNQVPPGILECFFLVNTRDLSTINFSEITLMFKILRLKWQIVWCVTNLILPQAVHKTKSLYFFLVSLYLIFKKLQRSKNHDVSPLKLCFVISPIHNNCHKTHYQSVVLNTHC